MEDLFTYISTTKGKYFHETKKIVKMKRLLHIEELMQAKFDEFFPEFLVDYDF